eukprot:Blabericola_migrator_1__9101@NODE_485_length_8114_cov_117_032807_g27_i2_p1_GENE_NODE_485_length_8114_cov_117_032807_g27_i2NODE_485_length_8114_cov_117_032807_g27_i2_p1_ORF_typecomplete_len1304_score328_63DNA_pol_B/PF00136_21/1_8e96DNA_pol_B_exo1/PF03104_19/2_5e20DNA_pol_B_exo1/PF03104_19/3e03DNA_pol_B_2/PF03175_13/0_0015Phage_HK97_TLTM/PF06120_11/0_4Phage_HK97_TLTM/PF06120_11/4_1e03Phage_HK97_TLTM/PF06120_11/7_4e03Phage_HK97_TLTM/PF06120_11/3_5e03USP19_linker/PF16602_5/16USP19_linker/PF16602_5/1
MPKAVAAHSLDAVMDKDHLRFFYLDLCDDPVTRGRVLLFGKVKDKTTDTYHSASIRVDYIAHSIFLRPKSQPEDPFDKTQRREVLKSLSGELRDILEAVRCPEVKITPVVRRVVFDSQAKEGSESIPLNKKELYMKLSFPFTFQLSQASVFLRDSFTHVFGLTTTAQEALLIKRKIQGPGWLAVVNPKLIDKRSDHTAGCALHLSVSSYKDLTPLVDTVTPPPLTLLTLNMKAVRGTGSTYTCVAVSMSGCKNFRVDETQHMQQLQSDQCLLGYVNPDVFKEQSSQQQDAPFNKVFYQLRDFVGALVHAIAAVDADVIIAHEFYGNTMATLIHLLVSCNTGNWACLGRVSTNVYQRLPQNLSKLSVYKQARTLFNGRLILDTYKLAQEALGSRTDYSLKTLMSEMGQGDITNALLTEGVLPSFITIWRTKLKQPRVDNFPALRNMVSHMRTVSKNPRLEPSGQMLTSLMGQAMHTETACVTLLVVKLQLLALTMELACVAGSVWDRSLFCQRAERNEYLLLHKFREEKIIVPSPRSRWQPGGQKGVAKSKDTARDDEENDTEAATFQGGLVLEPVAGYYDTYILYLDFASLYPSIIREFNLCFTTMASVESTRPELSLQADKNVSHPELIASRDRFDASQEETGLLPLLLQSLVERRRKVKTLISAQPHNQCLQTRQRALKLVANSIYGSLGFSFFRFYAPHIAATVTAWGRHILSITKDRVESQLGCTVVYGDTDSLMVNSGLKDEKTDTAKYYMAQDKAKAIVKEINKYHNKLELEVEGIFKKLLLLKKKKYAALKVVDPVRKIYAKELKGIDIVRRDWCGLTKVLGNQLINMIFDQNVEDQDTLGALIVELLTKTRTEMQENKIPLSLFVITRSLTKPLESYSTPKQFPHVMVALEMKRGGAQIHQGLEIPYIICTEARPEEKPTLADRAYHPDVVKAKNLTVDTAWYTDNQIFPPILRLCQFIESLSPFRLKEALGCVSGVEGDGDQQVMAVDAFAAQASNLKELKAELQTALSTEQVPLNHEISCIHCGKLVSLEQVVSTGACILCHKSWGLNDIIKQVNVFVSGLIMKYNRFQIRCTQCQSINSYGGCCRDCGTDRNLSLVLDLKNFEGMIGTMVSCLNRLKAHVTSHNSFLMDLCKFHQSELQLYMNAIEFAEDMLTKNIKALRALTKQEMVDLRPLMISSLPGGSSHTNEVYVE